ncbi:MAG: hypothetical protein KA004_06865 [Verrucomicrobiales bacterium]|nr:hypothetical protein [Verrucomicrobiales bacterium]
MKTSLAILPILLLITLPAVAQPERRLVGYANGKPLYVNSSAPRSSRAVQPSSLHYKGGGKQGTVGNRATAFKTAYRSGGVDRSRVHVGCTQIRHGGDHGCGYSLDRGSNGLDGVNFLTGRHSSLAGAGPFCQFGPMPNPARPIVHPFPGAAAVGYANIPRYAP